jgi:hypothetical protein
VQRALPACAASILFLSGCNGGAPPARPPPPEVTLERVAFRAWRGPELRASGTADRATYRKDSGEVVAAGAHAVVPRPGVPDLAVSAPELLGDLGARSWKARGGVVLTRGDATARTPSARWTESDGIVRGDEPVEVTGPSYRLAGPAFTADPATGDVEIRGGVRLVAGGAAR